MSLRAYPSLGLVDKTILIVVDSHRANRAFTKVKNLVPNGRPFPRNSRRLVVPVQMIFVGSVTDLLALQQFLANVWIARCGDKSWQPVKTGKDAVLDRVLGNVTRPAENCRHAESPFENRTFGLSKRGLTAIRPGEEFGSVVRGEQDNGVVLDAHVLDFGQYQPDVVIELGHAGLFFRPAIFSVAH